MNIRIFGTKKCNDTKKAGRYFKERNIKYRFIDLKEKNKKIVEDTRDNIISQGYKPCKNCNP